MKTWIKNATLINENRMQTGSVLIEDDTIAEVWSGILPENREAEAGTVVDAAGLWLMPGVIDDQVHFREPGLTHKGDIASESAAAVAGGVTSFMDMPNTVPQTTTIDALDRKFELGARSSLANYTFFLGATNDNLAELKRADPHRVGAIKLFMGSSTGNMLVDDASALERIFAEIELPIAVHCEKEERIRANRAYYVARYGEELPVRFHPLIRSAEACYESSAQAVDLAVRHGSRLHLFHLSTAREMSLLESKPLAEKRITGEVCVHHLYFNDGDYARYGNKIKWNPAIKTEADREALMQAVNDNRLDVIATDHAPHAWAEKQGSCLTAASGGPLIQFSLQTMIEKSRQGEIPLTRVVEKMCHAPADLYGIEKRGYIRPGYYADLTLVDPQKEFTVSPGNILSKCGWSPFEGHTFPVSVVKTYVNGVLVFDEGRIDRSYRGRELRFNG